MIALNEGIRAIIDQFSYEFYVVQQDFHISCSCVDFTTKQPDPACPKCLGTGHKVKIKKIKGASEDQKGSFRNIGIDERTTAVTYFITSKYPIYEKNIIVDEDDVLIVHRLEKKKSTNKEVVYYKVYAHYKKSNVKEFLENFYKVIRGDKK